uniref:Uncharacterized protein n=1 Tax=Arundo donax TaxID=35708 RepID=A0A0A9CBH2_ARUDO
MAAVGRVRLQHLTSLGSPGHAFQVRLWPRPTEHSFL